MAITKLNSLAIPPNTIVESDLSYPLTNFSSTGIDDNATSTAITIDSSENVGIGTASPSNQLHLNTTAASNVIQLTNSATGTGAGDGMQIVTSSLEMQLRNREAGPTTFYTSNIERMTIASGGNVGIGTSSPANKLDVNGILQSSSSGNYLQVQQSSTDGYINMTGSGGLNFRMGSGFDTRMTIDSSGNVGIGTTATANTRVYVRTALATDVAYLADNSTNSGFKVKFNSGSTAILNDFNAPLIFGTNDTERMRIDSSGNFLVGTSSLGGNSGRFQAVRSNSGAIGYFEVNNGSGVQNAVDITNAANAAFSPLRFWVNGYGTGSLVGSISCTTSATAYNTSSDQRLKDNIVDAPAGNINDIRVRSFDWKADGTHQPYGMIAQELVDVAPEAVTQGETEEDMWGVDYSKLVPMMIKEIQDLKAEVAALKGA